MRGIILIYRDVIMSLAFVVFAVFILGQLAAAYKDALTMTIPNWISVLIFFSFLVMTPFVWQGWMVFGEHMLVGVSVFLFGFTVFALGWLGGGDAKLMAATAFWGQWSDLIYYVFYTTMAGAVLAIFILAGRKYMPRAVLSADWIYRLVKDQKQMPYGLALAFGAIVTLPQSEIFKAAAIFG